MLDEYDVTGTYVIKIKTKKNKIKGYINLPVNFHGTLEKTLQSCWFTKNTSNWITSEYTIFIPHHLIFVMRVCLYL